MKRILIIGCPGSGKSTLARKLQARTGLPLFHLDMLYWNADKTTVTRDVFDERLGKVLARDEWIIDGNYQRTMEIRLQACDTVLFLDCPTDVCIDGILSRLGKQHADLPWIEDDVDEEFLSFVKTYSSAVRPQVLALLERYSDKNILVFHSRDEAEEWLAR